VKVSKLFSEIGWLIESDGAVQLMGLPVEEVTKLLVSGGAILFRGFGPNPDEFVEFSKRFSQQAVRHTNPALRPRVSADGTVTEVLTGNQEIELHGEMYYLPRRPSLLWLYCVTPNAHGGATTLADGVAVLAQLKSETRKLLREKRIKYLLNLDTAAWQTLTSTDDIDEAVTWLKKHADVTSIKKTAKNFIQICFVKHAVHQSKYGHQVFINSILNVLQYSHLKGNEVSFEDGSPLSEALLAELKIAGDRALQPLIWQAQDILMIENSRVMHGRQAFHGERKIYTRFTMDENMKNAA
jgi:alpha-ketoglutarate-dependent taurine dioxygenase